MTQERIQELRGKMCHFDNRVSMNETVVDDLDLERLLNMAERLCREYGEWESEEGPTDVQTERMSAQSHLAQEKRVLAEDQIERELKEIGHRSPFRP